MKKDKLRSIHMKTDLRGDDYDNILKVWSEGDLKYGDYLKFVVSKNGKKYIKRMFFYNYLLITKKDYESLEMFGFLDSLKKYILWTEDDSTPTEETVRQYEEDSGLKYPDHEEENKGFVRLYYNRHTIRIRNKSDEPIPCSMLTPENEFRPETARDLERLTEQYHQEKSETRDMKSDAYKDWKKANPFHIKASPEKYCMQGKSSDQRYLIRALNNYNISTYESRLSQEERLFINHGDRFKYKENPKILFFDIETDDRVKKQIVAGEFRILSLSFADFDQYTQDSKITHWRTEEDTDEAEKKFLLKVKDLFMKYDVISAWNGSFFDGPYIKKRFDYHDIEFDWRMLYEIDLMKIYQEFYKADRGDESMSFALESMGTVILGLQKISHEEGIYEMWEQLPEKLRKYNDRDVEIMCELEKKQGFLTNYLNICKTSNVSYEHTGNYNKVKRDFLKMCHDHKYFRVKDLTFEERNEMSGDKATGAFVAPPNPCLVDNVIAIDIGSLYPSAMMEFNICTSTMIPKDRWEEFEEKGIPHCETINGVRFRKDRMGFIPRMYGIVNKMRKYYKGIQSDLKNAGKIASSEYAVAESLEYSWKAKGLSIYGCLGLKSSIIYHIDLVESVTLTGQYFLTEGIKRLFGTKTHKAVTDPPTDSGDVFCKRFQEEGTTEEEINGKVDKLASFVYMDTDSYYIEVKKYINDNKEIVGNLSDLEPKSEEYIDALLKTGNHIVDIAHERYVELADEMKAFDKKIWLDFEQIYSKMIFFSAKKRYGGNLCWHKGNIIQGNKISFKGLELKRRDGIKYVKKNQEDMLNTLLTRGMDLKEMQETVVGMRKYILGELDTYPTFDELCVGGKVTKAVEEYDKPTTSVRMMIKQQKQGAILSVGSQIRYVVTRSNDGERDTDGISEQEFNQILKETGKPIYDKVYYWNAIYKAIFRISQVAFPEVDWEMFNIKKQAQEVEGSHLEESIKNYLTHEKKSSNLFSF